MTKAKEHKDQKTLKGQLLGAVAMMIVAAVALGTSTYAWFVNNTTTKVEGMQFQVSTATSLQVAVGVKGAAGTFTDFKNLVTKDDISGTADNQAKWDKMFDTADDYLMQPASISSNGLLSPTAAYDPTFFVSNGMMEGANLSQFKALNNVAEGAVKKIPLRFLSSSDIPVYFGGYQADGTTPYANIADFIRPITSDTTPAVPYADQAAAIQKALRVALVAHKVDGVAGYENDLVQIFQFSEDNLAAGATYNTYYDKVTKVDGTTYTLPDDAATRDAAIKALQNEAAGKYAAISKANPTTEGTPDLGMVTEVAAQTANLSTDAKFMAIVETDAATNAITAMKPENGTALFELKANEPRDVDVYIWLEGTDKDCVSILSQYQFVLDLPFAGATKEYTAPTP